MHKRVHGYRCDLKYALIYIYFYIGFQQCYGARVLTLVAFVQV